MKRGGFIAFEQGGEGSDDLEDFGRKWHSD